MKKLAFFIICAALALSSASLFGSAQTGTAKGAAEPVYSDVPAGAWYSDAVRDITERGIMNGTGGSAFDPSGTFTRAQLATVLYRMAGSPAVSGSDAFTDTEDGQWYSDAVLWCSEAGLVKGFGNGLFAPGDPVTQEQAAVMLWRAAGSPEPGSGSYEMSGQAAVSVSEYAKKAFAWALEYGIADREGWPAPEPGSPAERARAACMLSAYCAYIEGNYPGAGGEEPRYIRALEEDGEMILKIDGKQLEVSWEDNASVRALREMLQEGGAIEAGLSGYGGFEQVGALGHRLPSSDVRITTSPGDIVLYQSSRIVVFYGSNTWEYTRLRHIENMSAAQLRELLGGDKVTLTIERKEQR